MIRTDTLILLTQNYKISRISNSFGTSVENKLNWKNHFNILATNFIRIVSKYGDLKFMHKFTLHAS